MAGTRASRGGGVPRPPVVSGIPGVRWCDTVRLVGWTGRGFLHGARHGRGPGRVYSAVLAVAWVPGVPLLLVGQVIAVRRGSARYYLTPERDVVLAVVARSDGWHVTEHTAAAPGTGRGQVLRAAVAPALLQAADARGVTVHVIAANRGLADRYAGELPGLVDVGRGPVRGRRLQRAPRAPSVAEPISRPAVAAGEGALSLRPARHRRGISEPWT